MRSARDIKHAKNIAGVYAVTPDDLSTKTLIHLLDKIFDAGVRLLQLRRKRVTAGLLLNEATRIRHLASAYGATFIVNDNLALALEVGADGVHWGRDDAVLDDVTELARQIQSARQRAAATRAGTFLIGVSCYGDIARAEIAARAGADYVAFGSMFASTTKLHASLVPLSLITSAKRAFDIPIVAIGGITRDNAATLVEAGADAVAVISDLFSAETGEEIAARARAYQALFSP